MTAGEKADKAPKNKYSASLAELEASVRVPLDKQISEQPEAPAESPLSQGEVDRQTLIRIAGAP